MLNSLDIKNYRNLKELKINSLGRVNLITGKNNTGKSALLEAIAIYATKGDLALIYQLLGERGENFRRTEEDKNTTESNIRALSSMFTNRIVRFDNDGAISIGSIESTSSREKKSAKTFVFLRFVKHVDETQKDGQECMITKRRIALENEIDKQFEYCKVNIEISVKSDVATFELNSNPNSPGRYGVMGIEPGLGATQSLQFIRTRNIDREINGKLFDSITLTEKEAHVIDALKIIEPLTERIAFVEEAPRERTAVIKLSNNPRVLPLQSMGDGINRILTIILALVNADNGFLLIDEFENGLHHTVQKQLWNIIFNLAQKLNVQVFVTTHSEDCISGFESVLNSPGNSLDGKLIRLDNENGTIKQVEFNAHELKIANNQNIEIR